MSVYFAQRRQRGLIKIGWSRSVRVRVGTVRAKLIGAIPGARAEEKALHIRFAHLRVRGEWFRPGQDLMTYIQARAQDHEPDSESVQIATNVPRSWIERMVKLAKFMSGTIGTILVSNFVIDQVQP